jgi:hypothetical protein
MTTVNVDLAAITLTADELARARTRGTSGPLLVSVATRKITDLNDALGNLHNVCDAPNQGNIETIQAKLLP